MKRIAQFLCFSLLVLTFSCDPDETFDNENPSAKLEGEWKVVSVESISYSSTIASPNGQEDTSIGSFIGTDIDMTLIFNGDNTFTTAGDYNQVLSVESPLPEPIMIEARYNDFAGGGTYQIEGNTLQTRTSLDTEFQDASLSTFTDLEMEFDYKYSRTANDGTVKRITEVEVTYVLEKN